MPPKNRPAMHKKTKQIRHMKFYTHLHLLMACSNNGLRKLLKSCIPWKMESNLSLSTDIIFLNSFSNFITIFLNCLLKFSLNHLQIYEIIYNSFLFDGDILRNFTVISLFHFHQELKWIDFLRACFRYTMVLEYESIHFEVSRKIKFLLQKSLRNVNLEWRVEI